MSKAENMQMIFPKFQPLRIVGKEFVKFATKNVPYPSIEHSGRIRVIAHNVGIALGWMAKGNQYDTRTFIERMNAGNFYWRAALRAIVAAKSKGE